MDTISNASGITLSPILNWLATDLRQTEIHTVTSKCMGIIYVETNTVKNITIFSKADATVERM